MANNDLRILIIDDNPSIHQDFIKILTTVSSTDDLDKLDVALFGEKDISNVTLPQFKIDCASQGQEGVECIKEALQEQYPYALAFVDIRMPPGWDGIETIKHIWALDPNIQIVICTAYSDYTWEETVENLGITDNLLILKKPFDNVTVRQLTCSLIKKWQLMHDIKLYTDFLEKSIQERTQSLQESLSLIKATIESSADGILVVNLAGKIIEYNTQFIKMWEIPLAIMNSREEKAMLNYLAQQLKSPESFSQTTAEIAHNKEETSTDNIELQDGRIFERYSQPHRIEGVTVGRVWSFRDITKKYYLEQKLEHQATHDELTGLPNRVLFHDRIKQAINAANRSQTKVAVLFIDLDRFKLINDSLSHKAGDELLKAIAQRLKKLMRAEDTLARLGGDEFVAIVSHLANEEDSLLIANKFIDAFKEPFDILERKLYMSASIGISLYPDDAQTVDDLLRNADVAMYRAKEGGTNQFNYYTQEMMKNAIKRMEFETELRNALLNDEFFLTFQAQQDAQTGKILATEVLIRWHHPKHGVLLPIDFIPQAEVAGLMTAIGEWILRKACQQNKRWQEEGLPPIRVAINLTAVQLKQPHFVELVKRILNETALKAEYLEFEITENVIAGNPDALPIIQQLRELGIKITLDDFGTGNSSLNYLRKSSIDRLKIDKSFIEHVESNMNDELLIRSIIGMANSLQLEVIAEGVETAKQLDFLRKENCDNIQGYYFSQPLDSTHFETLLKQKGAAISDQ